MKGTSENFVSGQAPSAGMNPDDIDWPSEELNTAWGLFLPEEKLEEFITAYGGQSGAAGSGPN